MDKLTKRCGHTACISHKMHMKAYQDRGMCSTCVNRTTKNTATVTNHTTKTQKSHTQHQHETWDRRRTHTVRAMEEKTVTPTCTHENGVPHATRFFRDTRKGYPTPRGGDRLGRWGTPSRRDFSGLREWGTPSGREIPKCVFFLFVNRNAVAVSHVWFYRARGRHFGSSFTSFRSSAMPGTQHYISALYTNAETGPGMPRNPDHVPHRACPHRTL